jgi:hypothetical protein
MDNETSNSCKSCGSWWRLPLLLAIVLVAVWLMRSRGIGPDAADLNQVNEPAAPSDVVDPGQAVTVAIKFGDGNRIVFPPIAWHTGMTIHDAMRATFRNDARFKIKGTGEGAFLESIDGVANEGAGGRNWVYSVDGRVGDRSFAVYELEPGSEVLWTFGKEQ